MFSGASSSSTMKRLLYNSLVSAISSNIRSTRAHANSLEDEQEIADVKKALESLESMVKVLRNKAKTCRCHWTGSRCAVQISHSGWHSTPVGPGAVAQT